MTAINADLNKVMARVARRAEMNDPGVLARTFVEIPQISLGLRGVDHQVVYGRRGSGKTHAFNHLSVQLASEGDLPIYLDLRRLGSSSDIYSNQKDLSDCACNLLVDTISAIHGNLLEDAIASEHFDGMLEHLDGLAVAATRIRVQGSTTAETEIEGSSAEESSSGVDLGISSSGVNVSLKASDRRSRSARARKKTTRSGTELPHVIFGELGEVMERIANSVAPARIWLLLDEWSSVNISLQPFLADMLRRTFFTVKGITVKIGAIEARSRFAVRGQEGSYTGIELGSDTASALNLDDHLLEPEGGVEAVDFLSSLLFKHLNVLYDDLKMDMPFNDADKLMHHLFEPGPALRDYVRAAEGVPRDAINILGLSCMSAQAKPISQADIQRAARGYYMRDKETALVGNTSTQFVWDQLHAQVVLGECSRTFLIRRTEATPSEILDLFDARLIHLIRRGFSARSRPGVRFDGYSIDYGSYIKVLSDSEVDDAWNMRFSNADRNKGFRSYLDDRFDDKVIFNVEDVKQRARKQKRLT